MDEIREKHSIFNPKIYPIGRLEYFINTLKYVIPLIVVTLLFIFVCGDNPPDFITMLNIPILVIIVVITLLLIYLETINRAKRIYNTGLSKTKRDAIIIAIAVFAGSCIIPILGILAYYIVGFLLLFIPSR